MIIYYPGMGVLYFCLFVDIRKRDATLGFGVSVIVITVKILKVRTMHTTSTESSNGTLKDLTIMTTVGTMERHVGIGLQRV